MPSHHSPDGERDRVVAGSRHAARDREPRHIGDGRPHAPVLSRAATGVRLALLNDVECTGAGAGSEAEGAPADGVQAAGLRDTDVLPGSRCWPSHHGDRIPRGVVVL